jgi:hypothetical protein
MRVWQHYPSFKMIGQIPTETLKKLTTPPPKGFSSRAIRGNVDETGGRSRIEPASVPGHGTSRWTVSSFCHQGSNNVALESHGRRYRDDPRQGPSCR